MHVHIIHITDEKRMPNAEYYFGTDYWEDKIPYDMVNMWLSILDDGIKVEEMVGIDIPQKFHCCIVDDSVNQKNDSNIPVIPIGNKSLLHLPIANPFIPKTLDTNVDDSIKDEEIQVMFNGCASVQYNVFNNVFNSKEFQLLVPDSNNNVTVKPRLILSRDGFNGWYFVNPAYKNLPKLDIRVILYSKVICQNPLSAALTKLLCEILKEYLTESALYPASIAGLDTSISTSEDGTISLFVHGYSDKVFTLLQMIMDTLVHPDTMYCTDNITNNNIFKAQYASLLRYYANTNLSAAKASGNARRSLLIPSYFPADMKLSALEEIFPSLESSEAETSSLSNISTLRSALAAHVKDILQNACMNMLVHGNCPGDNALKYVNSIHKLFRNNHSSSTDSITGSLSWLNCPSHLVTNLCNTTDILSITSSTTNTNTNTNTKTQHGKGKKKKQIQILTANNTTHCIYQVIPANPNDANVSIEIYYQLDSGSDLDLDLDLDLDGIHCQDNGFLKSYAYFQDLQYLSLLEEILSESFFDTLRTQQQLGYTVELSLKDTLGILGFNFVVVSSMFNNKLIEDSIFQFVESIPIILQNMTDEIFNRYINGYIMTQFKVEPSLYEASSCQIWPCIEERDYCFEYDRQCGMYLRDKYTVNCKNTNISDCSDNNNNSTGNKLTLSDLKTELIAFAMRLFHINTNNSIALSTSADTNNTTNNNFNVLIVRTFHNHINKQKKTQINTNMTENAINMNLIGCDDGTDSTNTNNGKNKGIESKHKKCNCGLLKHVNKSIMNTCMICAPVHFQKNKNIREYHISDVHMDFHSKFGLRKCLM